MKHDRQHNNPMHEPTTKYGEFIASFERWILPEKQQEIAEKLQKPIGKH